MELEHGPFVHPVTAEQEKMFDHDLSPEKEVAALCFRWSMVEAETISYAGAGAPRWPVASDVVFDRKRPRSSLVAIRQWWHRSKRPVSSSVPRGSRRRHWRSSKWPELTGRGQFSSHRRKPHFDGHGGSSGQRDGQWVAAFDSMEQGEVDSGGGR